jgi:light-regulated signal transduction histidine kinase (bacteriophytochrome)
MKIEEVDLSQLAMEVVESLKQQAPERTVDVVVRPAMSVTGDPGLLRIMLENLLGNAWKYTSKRDGARIEFGRNIVDGETAYYVSDNGVGFDMQYADRLFGAFQRLHGDEFEGTGIGLVIVQRIVRRHGGSIRAEGSPGEGATFYFTLGAAGAVAVRGR